MKRTRIEISGLVQGVGFRPFVYRAACDHSLSGFVRNTNVGIVIEVEGKLQNIATFMSTIDRHRPPAAIVISQQSINIPLQGESGFRISATRESGRGGASVPKDRATCEACLCELHDAHDRRFQYPFITCNDCGPRFTITKSLPFDRVNTSMAGFPLCTSCLAEYNDPTARRFHAQTISCAKCGPRLSYNGDHNDALRRAVTALKNNEIIAIKGVGGYQLVCRATSESAINRIRVFKHRKQKPLAVMAPDVAAVQSMCYLSAREHEELSSAAAPMVLLKAKIRCKMIHTTVNPGIQTLGVMLPNNPLHHLIMMPLSEWLVVTSANRRGEPIITDDNEAHVKLASVVDGILSHNRPIVHLADDSMMRVTDEDHIVLRLGRGLAPIELPFGHSSPQKSYAVGFGGHSKSAFALSLKDRAILSQHIGELENLDTRSRFEKERISFEKLYQINASSDDPWYCDAHPDYGSTALAQRRTSSVNQVYHHEAHVRSLMLEQPNFAKPALGVVCDGSGLGTDGTIWGGEFFLIDDHHLQRVGSLLPFPLPGGDLAVKEPRRAAIGMLYQTYGTDESHGRHARDSFSPSEQNILMTTMQQGINAPLTSSLGRLFDGFASILGVCQKAEYEAQAAMALEELAEQNHSFEALPVHWQLNEKGLWRWDWRNLVPLACEAMDRAKNDKSQDCRQFSAAFHATIIQAVIELAQKLRVRSILLSGGVFQNALLLKMCRQRLPSMGLDMITHRLTPCGDGGLALGQIAGHGSSIDAPALNTRTY